MRTISQRFSIGNFLKTSSHEVLSNTYAIYLFIPTSEKWCTDVMETYTHSLPDVNTIFTFIFMATEGLNCIHLAVGH